MKRLTITIWKTNNQRRVLRLAVWTIPMICNLLGFWAHDHVRSHIPMWLTTLEREYVMFLLDERETLMSRRTVKSQMQLGCHLQIRSFQGKDHDDQCQAKRRAKQVEPLNTPLIFKTEKYTSQPWKHIITASLLMNIVSHLIPQHIFQKIDILNCDYFEPPILTQLTNTFRWPQQPPKIILATLKRRTPFVRRFKPRLRKYLT